MENSQKANIKYPKYKIIEGVFECGYRILVPPEGVFSWAGHTHFCSHESIREEKKTCEFEKDYGWSINKGNFPIYCPLKNIR
jgi:hypothetical protein